MSHSEAPFSRVAILNRGEPALRFLRGLREYNLEHGTALLAIAFYTDPDSQAPFVRLADEAVPLGPALVEVAPGNMSSAYCAHESVLALLKRNNCDAVWPGWGFVSEDAAFVEKLEKAGITFLGPSSTAMRALGDKIASKQLAETSGVPLAPWHDITTASNDEIIAFAEDIGYPLMVKASAGGGGRGIRKINEASALLAGVKSADDEARKAFGEGGLFIEKCIDNARHVEVQLVADAHGGAWAIGVRDCSIQRRNQKVLEETPSPVLPADKELELLRASERLVLAAGYEGVGTAEYLYRPEDGTLAFLEVNSRLQVEHTITEQTTGADLVAAQISIARGLAWTAPEGSRGWAFEARLNAEDPERGFAPSPGLVRVFRPPSGPGIRVDSGVVEGMMIAPEFDSMIAKVISWGATRAQAIARMQRALAEMEVVIENGATNKAFLLQLLSTEAVIDGSASTQWLDRAVEERSLAPAGGDQQALLVAAVISFRIEHGADMQRFFAESQMGVPQNLSSPSGRKVSLRLRGKRLDVVVFETGRDRYTVVSEEGERRVRLEPTGAHAALLEVDGRRHRVTYADGRSGISVEIDGVAHAVERSTGGEVRAQAPAMVVSVSVEAGQTVEVGDRLVTLEAMKMEMPVFAQEAGMVQAVLCRPNQQVIAGQAMVVVKPEEREGQSDDAIALETSPIRPIELLFSGGAPKPETLDEAPDEIVDAFIDDVVEACRTVLLGFDVTEKIEGLVDTLFGADLQFHHVNKKGPWMRLVLLMEEFANVETLFRRDAIPDASSAVSLSPELAFYEFCRCHHLGDDGVPAPIDADLRRALACYGVTSLDATVAVREALYRMAVAHAHTDLRHRVVSSLLRLLIGLHDSHIAFDDLPGLQRLLDHVAEVASSKHPYVADNARQASYVTVRQAHYVTTDARVESALDSALDAWREAGGEVERDQLEFAIASAQTVLPAILGRICPGDDASVGFVDAAVRRLYERRNVERVSIEPREGFWLGQFTLCATEHEPRGESLVVAVADAKSLAATIDRVMSAATQQSSATAGEQPSVDLLLSSTEEVEHIVKEVEHLLEDIPQSRRRVKRLTVTWFDATKVERHRTYQFGTGRYEEMSQYRDIHPEAARRIRLERLSEFVLERLPSPERIHAFRGVARSNSKDERVFVIAEVFGRATPPEGQEDTWPRWEFEKVFYQGVRILREAQAKRTRRTRLFRNRMTIFLHPEL
ncbi:MAG: acetyl/propionyl-CoA carboxylase alpha subunit, partial [Bradymonadia bacterium]